MVNDTQRPLKAQSGLKRNFRLVVSGQHYIPYGYETAA